MKCPLCGTEDQFITLDSRAQPFGIKRRKRCLTCNRNFATVEIAEYSDDAIKCLDITNRNIEARRKGRIYETL